MEKIMRMRLLGGAAMAIAFAASGASATEDGWYGALDVGYHKNEHMNAYSSGLANDVISTYGDVIGFGRVGYRFSPYLRLELEGGYRAGDIKHISAADNFNSICGQNLVGACTHPGGDEHAFSVMGNLLVDLIPNWKFSPF